MSKEVTIKQQNQLSTETLVNDWGVPTGPSQDMVIPKILPMQLTSVLVSEGKAVMGEFRDSINGQLLGTIDKPMEIIPFYVDKQWDIQKMAEGQFKYSHSLPLVENPLDPAYNDNLQWEGVEDGVQVRRVRRMNFFVLLPKEVESGESMPYVLSFKSTSAKEGKKLWTQMYVRNVRAGLPPAAYTFMLSGVKQKNDKGSFCVPQVALGRKATDKELQECLSWLKLVRKGAVKVDTSEEGDTSATAGAEDIEF